MRSPSIVPSLILTGLFVSFASALEPDQVIVRPSLEAADLPDGVTLVPVPAGVPVTRHVVSPDGTVSAYAGDPAGTLVYSNTRGGVLLSIPAGYMLADDVFTTAVGGCNLAAYELLVGGSGDGTGPGFTVNYALYDACPGNGGQVIPGTEGSFDVPDDGLHWITVDLSSAPVPVGAALWVSTSFSSDTAGWMVGAQADIGFTDDVYDMIFVPRCAGRFGGTDLHAGFAAKLYCDGAVDTQFLAYLNTGPGQIVNQGANQTVLDDVSLFVDDCVLAGYDVGLLGNAGPFNADIALWFDCVESSLIQGTEFTYQGIGNGQAETASVSFPGGLQLPAPLFWVAVTPSKSSTGPIVSGEPTIGYSDDLYAVWDQPADPGSCSMYWFGGNPYAAFQVAVYCLGDPPLGACCQIPPPPGSPPCAVTTELSCTTGRWLEGATCDPDPFDPPCGTFACCLPNDSCENLTEADCLDAGGTWQRDRFCQVGTQECPYYACLNGEGDCCAADTQPGCGTASCCQLVCGIDEWCCRVEWDQFCADEAQELCGAACPLGAVTFLDPANGTVDARQPHPIGDASTPQGIDTFRVTAPSAAAGSCCWSVCETAHPGIPNSIASVEPDGTGAMVIRLARPITTGAVTTITYAGTGATGTFTSHPGNVDGDAQTSPPDIIALIDCINGVGGCPYDLYSCDIDHNGVCSPPDIVRLVDLLNGAGTFDPWSGTALPVNLGECP